MAKAPVKPPLHNFPPTFFKWGSKSKTPHRFRRSPSTPDEERESSAVAKPAEPEPEPEPEPAEVEGEKPWNLRPRRTPALSSSVTATAKLTSPENLPKSMRLREGVGGERLGERREKRRFWIALSKEEIEEDIYALTGSKPSRRPRRRPRNVQKQLDNIFPGLWLVGLSAETYRNLDNPPNR